MDQRAKSFNEVRPALLSLARRILGNASEAEDIIQEAYVRWEASDQEKVRSPQAFLTTVVTRLCLNHLNLARVRLEHSDAPDLLENLSSASRSPAENAELADALGEVFIRLMGNLSPTERAVFLLREAFDFDYADIAPLVNRTQENCRQIHRRARQRVQSGERAEIASSQAEERVVAEFIRAAQTGEMEDLLESLAGDGVLYRDPGDLSRPALPPLADKAGIREAISTFFADLNARGCSFSAIPFGGSRQLLLGRTGNAMAGAVLISTEGEKVRAVHLVRCPALLRQIRILIALVAPRVFNKDQNPTEN